MHSRKRLRLESYDYSSGIYLVTVCTYRRRCILGSIPDESFVPNSLGVVVEQQFARTERFERARVDSLAVMPNHVHAIICLTGAATQMRARQASPLLGHVVGAIKSASTREINLLGSTPGAKVWQRGYHDHVVRDERDLRRVRDYVEANPIRWALDPENPVRR